MRKQLEEQFRHEVLLGMIGYIEGHTLCVSSKALAVLWACEHLQLYIYGKLIAVYNDHKPFASIYDNPSSKPPARIDRRGFRLQPYQGKIKYRIKQIQQITCPQPPAKSSVQGSGRVREAIFNHINP